MPKKSRRFEPAYGVSRPMLEAEARAVNREMETYLRRSTTELRERLDERGTSWNQADESLHGAVSSLPERERLAIRCLIIRDFHHLLELYIEWFRTYAPRIESPAPPPTQPPEERKEPLPFSEWLFGS